MDDKVKDLLGLNESEQKLERGRVGTTAKTNLYVQKKGFLWKKPFSAKSLVKHQKWQKRWFVLKDSFLIWYKSRPSNGDFDLYPAGVLPLGGCGVFPQGRSSDGYEFELTHPDFNDASLLLRSTEEEDANDWIRWLGLCKEATWENAMLGDAQMMTLKTKDTKLEREAQEALERAQTNAMEIQDKRLERQKMMEQHEKRQLQYKEQLMETKRKTEALKKAEATNLQAIQERKKRVEAEIAEKRKLEKQLLNAKEALIKLETLLKERTTEKKESLLQDIQQLKDFLSANLDEDTLKRDETHSVTSYEPENLDYDDDDDI